MRQDVTLRIGSDGLACRPPVSSPTALNSSQPVYPLIPVASATIGRSASLASHPAQQRCGRTSPCLAAFLFSRGPYPNFGIRRLGRRLAQGDGLRILEHALATS